MRVTVKIHVLDASEEDARVPINLGIVLTVYLTDSFSTVFKNRLIYAEVFNLRVA